MTISMIKLTNGETLLGDIISEDEWTITINNPIAIMVKMRFSPTMVSHLWLPFSDMDNYFDIKTDHVITQKEVDDDMILYYNNCIDTIHDNMTETKSFLLDTESEEADAQAKIDEYLDRLEARNYGANTVFH
mgnify:CR=1 FL=1